MNNANGSVFKYPDNVDTDVIIPARHLNTQDARELASHCMEDIDKDFINNVKDGDIMVGGWNFGCGSSREHAPLAIKTAGISVVIAKSFARIFYRNSINIGLPIMDFGASPVYGSADGVTLSQNFTFCKGIKSAAKQQIGETRKKRLAQRLAFFRFDFFFGLVKGEQSLTRCGESGVQR